MLNIWVVRHCPPSRYPLPSGATFVGPVESIALWRDALLSGLKGRGTFAACEAIRRITSELPELDQLMLKWILLEARTLAHRNTWQPVRPQEFLKLIGNNQLRLVQSGEQLLAVVIKSLKRLEKKFHDELPAWPDVWDRVFVEQVSSSTEKKPQKKLKYRPKDENEFSNRIARHLREELTEKGIITNREVVIRKSERTDIHFVGAI